MAHILLVEDEAGVASFVSRGLLEEGHQLEWSKDGVSGLETALDSDFDLILLDVRLPFLDGYEVARKLRIHKPDVPILMLTALNAVEDRVAGLRAGADDYLAKPFAFEELVARIDSLLRRSSRSGHVTVSKIPGLEMYPLEKKAMWKGDDLPFTLQEFDLFAYLVARIGHVTSREDLLRDVWGERFNRGTNVVDVYVSYVRQKLEVARCPIRFESIRGVGYKTVVTQQEPSNE